MSDNTLETVSTVEPLPVERQVLAPPNTLAVPIAAENASVPIQSAEPVLTAGKMLRQAREAAGLSIEVLASTLKVPGKKLEALEQERFELLPDAVFVRGLAASICRSLHIDAQPVLALLPQNTRVQLAAPEPRLQPPYIPRPLGFTASWGPTSKRFTAWAAVMVLGLGGMLWAYHHDFWRSVDSGESSAAAHSEPPETSSAAAVAPTGSSSDSAASALPAALTAATAAPTAAPMVVLPVAQQAALAAAPLRLAGASAAALPAVVASAAPLSSNSILVLRATQYSWVEVSDAQRRVLLRRTLNPGEVVGLSGALPMRAVLGRADAMQVEVRGQSVNLKPVSRDNVARFEVR